MENGWDGPEWPGMRFSTKPNLSTCRTEHIQFCFFELCFLFFFGQHFLHFQFTELFQYVNLILSEGFRYNYLHCYKMVTSKLYRIVVFRWLEGPSAVLLKGNFVAILCSCRDLYVELTVYSFYRYPCSKNRLTYGDG